MNLSTYANTLKSRRAAQPKTQSTRHVTEAIETWEMLKDEPYWKGRYLRLFKKYRSGPEHDALIKCRDWVLSRNPPAKAPGAMFFKTVPKFLNPKPYQPKQ